MSKKNKQLTDGQKLAKRLDAVIRRSGLTLSILPAPLKPSDLERPHADDAQK